MLTETRLHEKREAKRIRRLLIVRLKQQRMERLKRHVYGRPKQIRTSNSYDSFHKETQMGFWAKVKSLMKWNK